MNTMKTKRDMSFEIQHAAKWLGVSYREIAIASNVGASTISRAARHGYKVNRSTHLAIAQGIQSLMPTHSARCIATPVTDEYTPTATLAANLEKQVEQLRDTIERTPLQPLHIVDTTKQPQMVIRDDLLESAHSREKAELQKALAARIDELKAERNKGLSTLAQLSRAEDLLKTERLKNETQYQSIGQCFAEIHRLQDNLKDAQSVIAVQEKQIDLGLDENDRLKRLVALRTQDLAVYQKELEAADNRADDAEYKAAEFERDFVQRAWTWFFLVLAFVVAVVGVVK